MRDALARHYERSEYERDVEIVDEPISVPRVSTEELAMHVQLDDGWHRQDAGGIETACGIPINVRLMLGTRNERHLEHPLARCECWTKRERAKAGDKYRQQYGHDYKP